MRKASLGTIFLTVFLDLLGFGLVMPFLPGVARDMGASDFWASVLGAAFSLMQFLFIPLWGRLSDRVGRRPVLLWSIAATAAGMLLLGFANSVAWLFVARLFSGIATANLAVAQAYIADITTPETRARGMGLIGMAFGFGFIIGPAVGGVLGDIELWGRPGPVAAFAAAGLSVVNFFAALRFVPESLPKERRGSDRKSAAARLALFDFEAYRAAKAVAGLPRVLVISFVTIFFFAGLEVTYRLFTVDAFQMSTSGTGWVFTFIGIVAAVTQGGLIGRLSRRFGEVRLLRWGPLGLGVAFLIVGTSAHLDPGLGYVVFVAGSGLVAFSNGITIPSLSSYVSQQTGIERQGATLGVMQSLNALSRALAPFVAGLAYEFSLSAPYLLGGAGLLGVALLARGLPPLRLVKAPSDPQSSRSATA